MECDCIALPGEPISMVASNSGRGLSWGDKDIGSPFNLLPNVPSYTKLLRHKQGKLTHQIRIQELRSRKFCLEVEVIQQNHLL